MHIHLRAGIGDELTRTPKPLTLRGPGQMPFIDTVGIKTSSSAAGFSESR